MIPGEEKITNKCRVIRTGNVTFFECTATDDCEHNPNLQYGNGHNCSFRLRGSTTYLCTKYAAHLDALKGNGR